jgi:hypothetical protein
LDEAFNPRGEFEKTGIPLEEPLCLWYMQIPSQNGMPGEFIPSKENGLELSNDSKPHIF